MSRPPQEPASPETPSACPICGGTAWRRVHTNIRATAFSVFRCASSGVCGVERLWPEPAWEQIKAFYDASYYKAWGMERGEVTEVGKMKKRTFARRVRQIQRFIATGKILDVGTASGFFLEVAQQRGFEPYGVELSEYSGRLAADKFGPPHIHIGTLETAPFLPAMFDAVAMSDLLEHVADPVATLTQAARLLRPGGVILVMTPNRASLTHHLMGRNWSHFKIEHLFYFDRKSITHAAKKAGLDVAYFRPAVKTLTLRYLHTQLRTYPHWLLSPLARAAYTLGFFARDWPLPVVIGEFVAILRKP